MNLNTYIKASILGCIIYFPGSSYAFNLFGPSNFEECQTKYVKEAYKPNNVKRAINRACHLKFSYNPTTPDEENLQKSAKCFLSDIDDVVSPDTAIAVASRCATKYKSKGFPGVVTRAVND